MILALIFLTFFSLGAILGEMSLHTKEAIFMQSPRDEMEARAIRIIIRSDETIKDKTLRQNFYTGNGIYIAKGLVLTNHHICYGMKKENMVPNTLTLVQDKYGDEYKVDSQVVENTKDLCLLKVGKIHLKYIPILNLLNPDPQVTDTLVGAAYSYANPQTNVRGVMSKFFMFQERRAQVLERSTMNHNSIDYPQIGEGEPPFAEQFSGPLYKLSSLINYGDSGGGVYLLNNGTLSLAGIIFAKEYATPYPAQGYMVPASSIIQFLKKNNVSLGN